MKTFWVIFTKWHQKVSKNHYVFHYKLVVLYAKTKNQISETLIKPVDYEDFWPPEFKSDPKKYQKSIRFFTQNDKVGKSIWYSQ